MPARLVLVAALIVGGGVGLASARDGAKPWARAKAPAAGTPSSIGGYSNGCLRGGAALPLDGPGYQVMRPSRHRYFGHPELVDFVKDLGARMKRAGLGVLLVGDLGQARGGPAPSGHASHQTGLDADLWYWHPKKATKRRLTDREREKTSARAVADVGKKAMTGQWSPRVARVLRIAAEDQRVARIFVNPLVKRAACAAAGTERAWLRKLRPWWGHHRHFHVRLACPAGSSACVPQQELPPGDGCADVDWWLDDKAQAERKKNRGKYRDKIRTMPQLPAQCSEVLKAPAAT